MADVKDILGVPRSGLAPEERKSKKEERMKRPEGMSREAFALLDGSHPITPSHLLEGLTKKKKAAAAARPRPHSSKGTVVWRFKPFRNQARSDGLELRHWAKGFKDALGRVRDADEGDYPFAKYNKRAPTVRYDDEEWEAVVRDDSCGWGRAETDYLLSLACDLDLRWLVVADRYNFPGGAPRSLEDLKERYYAVARKLLRVREADDASLANHPLLKYPYSAAHERARKAALEAMLLRDVAVEEREQQVLEQARVIEDRRKADLAVQNAAAAAAARKAAAAAAPPPRAAPPPIASVVVEVPTFPQEFSNQPPPGLPSLFNISLNPCKAPPGVTTRSLHTRDTAAAMAGASSRDPKRLEQAMVDVGWGVQPGDKLRFHTRELAGHWLALNAEVATLLDARQAYSKRVQDVRKAEKRKHVSDSAPRSEKRQRVAKRFD